MLFERLYLPRFHSRGFKQNGRKNTPKLSHSSFNRPDTMPRLSDYLAADAAGAAGAAAAPVLRPLPTRPAQPLQQQQQQQHDPELARLAQQHANRLKQHGQRMYRQADGSLGTGAQPAERQPYTVANRRKWHGLVRHCRQLPGVNPQLERTGDCDAGACAAAWWRVCSTGLLQPVAVPDAAAGRSARHGINVTHEQHAAALAAAGALWLRGSCGGCPLAVLVVC